MTNNDDLQREVNELANPTDRPPANPAQNAYSMQLVDRSRLLQAWESNVRTMKGVLQQLEMSRKTNIITRALVAAATVANAFMLWAVISVVRDGVDHLKETRDTISQEAVANRERSELQQQKLDKVSEAMVELMRARIAEDEARARPKDQSLQKEASAAKMSALVTTLEAKREVAPPSEKREAEKQLQQLKTLAPK